MINNGSVLLSFPRKRGRGNLLRPIAKIAAVISRRSLRLDGLAVGRHPAPGARPVAARGDALLVDVGHLVAVAGKQGLGRAHLGAQWQFALGETIGAVFLVLLLRAVQLGAAG